MMENKLIGVNGTAHNVHASFCYEGAKRRLANRLCPFCRKDDVWEIDYDQSTVKPKLLMYCGHCGKKFRTRNFDDVQDSMDVCCDEVMDLMLKYDRPLTVFDIKTVLYADCDDSDKEKIFENNTDAFLYFLSQIRYDEYDVYKKQKKYKF